MLTNLTEDILDFAKIEAGLFTLDKTTFTVGDVIDEAAFIFELQCQQKGIYFRVECFDEVRRASFHSDKSRIRQVLLNLLSNAFKFTNQGGITLAAEFDRSSCGNKMLKLAVLDTGEGISKSEKKSLFKMFSESRSQQDTFNLKGTGLGLTLSQKLVYHLGGAMTLRSERGIGTSVSFTVAGDEGERRLVVDEEDDVLSLQ